LGDISYADDDFLHNPVQFNYENVWNGYMNWMQDIMATKPYMVLVGNHESECHSPACLDDEERRTKLGNFSAYNHRFKMPSEESGGVMNMWYSFSYANAHFISFNTETDYPHAPEANTGDSHLLPAGHFGYDGELMAWFENELIKANASRHIRPWIIVGGHRPIYEATGVNVDLQNLIEDLLYKYQVDIYFCGHVHSYARSYPVYQGQAVKSYVNPPYPTYVLVGGAGCDEMSGAQGVELSDWCAYQDTTYYATGILTVYNSTTLTWEYIISKDGTVKDSFTITKNPPALK